MKEEPRRGFSFTRLYKMAFESLPTSETKAAFADAVFNYGLDKTLPDFGDNETLKAAWNEVFPDLSYSWTQFEKGTHGGNVTQQRKEGKKSKAQTTAPKPEPLPVPPDEEPTPAFIKILQNNGLCSVACSPKPLTRPQWEYMGKAYGKEYATKLLSILEYWIERKKDFWDDPKHSGRSVFDLIRTRAEGEMKAFDAWMAEAFPKVASMDPYPLTFPQYLELRKTYGRANVLVKLKQMNELPKLNKRAKAYDVALAWIKRSVKQGTAHRFGLPNFDDAASSPAVPEVLPGFDMDFETKVSGTYPF